MKNPLKLLRLQALLAGQPLDEGPADPALLLAELGPYGPGPRPRRSLRARLLALVGGMGGFYAVSLVGHVLLVGAVATVPLKIGPMLHTKPRRKPVNTELAAARDNATFEFVPSTGDGPRPRQVAGPADKGGEETKPADSAGQNSPLAIADAEPVNAAAEAADAQAAEAAVTAALVWLARHQQPDGRWSLVDFEHQCSAGRCGGAGDIRSDAAATALALLPFLLAHDAVSSSARGQEAVVRGVRWLLERQRPDGDLSAEGDQRMYTHAVAGLALCQYCATYHDTRILSAIQLAAQFTVAAQNPATGGWHYNPGGRGNTSSVAWQLLFLHAAEACGADVDPQCWQRARNWLASVEQGRAHGLFGYEPQRRPTPTMTSVGLLDLQYRGARLDDPAMVEGRAFLLANPPDKAFARDVFYWYLGSQSVRHLTIGEWLPWYRRLRRDLVDSQVTSGCAAGSWYVGPAAPELWSVRAGRLLTTSLAAQLLAAGPGQAPLAPPARPAPMAAAAGTVRK